MKVFWTGRCLHSVIDVFLILNFDDQFCHDESQLDFKRVKVSQTWLDVFLKFKFSFFFSFLQVDWHNRYKWMQRIPRARWEGYTFKSQWFIHLLPLYTSCSKNIILVNYYVEYFFLLCWMGNPQKLPYQTIIFIGGLECFNQDYIT